MAVDLSKLRGMGSEDLVREAGALREEIWKLRLQGARGQLQDPRKITQARKRLARVLTVKREQELAQAKEGGR